MDEEIERLVVSVRADTQGFADDVATMRRTLEGPFGEGVDKAGRMLESTLVRAIRTGKLGFEDLKHVALSVMAEIASSAIRTGLDSLFGGGQRGGGGILSLGTSLIGSVLGLPGRATGGPVSPGRAYMVGERGPELFVPTASGAIAAPSPRAGRDVRVSIAINAPAGSAPDMLARSSRQVARAVRNAMMQED
ncbi:MAG: tail tape measure protein [Sphingomonadales bacterium]|jgi:phage-related minor tail protein|nr:tail tape measure protein [Sphingomonadales bacterium]